MLAETRNLVIIYVVEMIQYIGKYAHVIGNFKALGSIQPNIDLQRLACERNRLLPRFLHLFGQDASRTCQSVYGSSKRT